ncbi:hypothetical protein V2S66_04080 [Streptomyces sp. V4-01]|uniref:Uncharacterized protein n=1 Tax=Actinacidiphila polyblastidii TaxID=3110430 RepID=A0ABU7P5R3_9ACTN|nr:hypothetical protein [Streptomyces sp. V4-01]
MPFLDDCARSTLGTPTEINYPQLIAADRGDLELLKRHTTHTLGRLLRRQAALQALHDRGRSADLLAYTNAEPGYLASTGLPIRSSHSGRPIDNGLPQGPYTAPPPAATAGIRGRANYAWLKESVTAHTTHPAAATGLTTDLNRVPSYFEFHISTIHSRGNGQALLEGGRLVYDPFNHRIFLSAHYVAEFELINLPAVTADPAYAALDQRIQAYANAQVGGLPPWANLYIDLDIEMANDQL